MNALFQKSKDNPHPRLLSFPNLFSIRIWNGTIGLVEARIKVFEDLAGKVYFEGSDARIFLRTKINWSSNADYPLGSKERTIAISQLSADPFDRKVHWAKLCEKLNQQAFVRIHRSFMINLFKIGSRSENHVEWRKNPPDWQAIQGGIYYADGE